MVEIGYWVFLQHVLDTLPSSIYLFYGPDARLLLTNHAASRVWGVVWQLDQPMQDFLAANQIGLFETQGRILAHELCTTLHAVQRGETVLQHQEIIRHAVGSEPAGAGQRRAVIGAAVLAASRGGYG